MASPKTMPKPTRSIFVRLKDSLESLRLERRVASGREKVSLTRSLFDRIFKRHMIKPEDRMD